MTRLWVFVKNTNADMDESHDFVCEFLNIDEFTENNELWDSFYNNWVDAYVN